MQIKNRRFIVPKVEKVLTTIEYSSNQSTNSVPKLMLQWEINFNILTKFGNRCQSDSVNRFSQFPVWITRFASWMESSGGLAHGIRSLYVFVYEFIYVSVHTFAFDWSLEYKTNSAWRTGQWDQVSWTAVLGYSSILMPPSAGKTSERMA